MHSRAVGSLVLAFLAALVLASSTPSVMAAEESGSWDGYVEYVGSGSSGGRTGPAMYKVYNADDPSVNWEWNFKKCATMDQNTPMAWRSRYRWAEFCDLGEPNDMCSKCLQVMNAVTEDNNSVIVRIMDICDETSDGVVLRMDKVAFDQINTGNQGDGNERLMVNYGIVNCEDPK